MFNNKTLYLLTVLFGAIILGCIYNMCGRYPWVWSHRIRETFTDDNSSASSAPFVPSAPSAPLTPPADVDLSEEAVIATTKQQQGELISNIRDLIREENLRNRSVNNQATLTTSAEPEGAFAVKSSCPSPGITCSSSGSSCPLVSGGRVGTPGLLQGMECLTKKQQDCLKNPDAYIKKDTIPCWGCSL